MKKSLEDNFRGLQPLIPKFNLVYYATEDYARRNKSKSGADFDTVVGKGVEEISEKELCDENAKARLEEKVKGDASIFEEDHVVGGFMGNPEMLYSEKLRKIMKRLGPMAPLPLYIIKLLIGYVKEKYAPK